jgi:hypothetical protein
METMLHEPLGKRLHPNESIEESAADDCHQRKKNQSHIQSGSGWLKVETLFFLGEKSRFLTTFWPSWAEEE